MSRAGVPDPICLVNVNSEMGIAGTGILPVRERNQIGQEVIRCHKSASASRRPT